MLMAYLDNTKEYRVKWCFLSIRINRLSRSSLVFTIRRNIHALNIYLCMMIREIFVCDIELPPREKSKQCILQLSKLRHPPCEIQNTFGHFRKNDETS